MIRNVLTDIGGIGLYGVISICLFFVLFSGFLIWAFLLRKPHLNQMSQLPLDDGSHETSQPTDHEKR